MASTSKNYGYIRVSTVAQNLDRQTDALTTAGIAPADIFSDKVSGKSMDRPGLKSLRSHLRPGDTVTVFSMDRLGRSALHVMQTIAELEEMDVTVVSLKPGESQYTGATGKFMAQMMMLVAEWERSMNAERVAEARAAKAARAKTGEQVAGRPRTALAPAKVAEVRKFKSKGLTPTEIAVAAKISRASVYRALAE